MKRFKRLLSIILAGAILAATLVCPASAAGIERFPDADWISYTEAVSAMAKLGIINGKDDGSFDPHGNVTRGEMAKMIAVALNGGKSTYTGVKGVATYTDIKDHWAESYIEYCADLGIISGRGDGRFAPNDNVTILEVAKMVLVTLGYDAQAYNLTGAAWSTHTNERALRCEPSLYAGLTRVNASSYASREEAAQLIWNGLQNNTMVVIPSSTNITTWNYVPGEILLKKCFGVSVSSVLDQAGSSGSSFSGGSQSSSVSSSALSSSQMAELLNETCWRARGDASLSAVFHLFHSNGTYDYVYPALQLVGDGIWTYSNGILKVVDDKGGTGYYKCVKDGGSYYFTDAYGSSSAMGREDEDMFYSLYHDLIRDQGSSPANSSTRYTIQRAPDLDGKRTNFAFHDVWVPDGFRIDNIVTYAYAVVREDTGERMTTFALDWIEDFYEYEDIKIVSQTNSATVINYCCDNSGSAIRYDANSNSLLSMPKGYYSQIGNYLLCEDITGTYEFTFLDIYSLDGLLVERLADNRWYPCYYRDGNKIFYAYGGTWDSKDTDIKVFSCDMNTLEKKLLLTVQGKTSTSLHWIRDGMISYDETTASFPTN